MQTRLVFALLASAAWLLGSAAGSTRGLAAEPPYMHTVYLTVPSPQKALGDKWVVDLSTRRQWDDLLRELAPSPSNTSWMCVPVAALPVTWGSIPCPLTGRVTLP